MIVQLKIIVGVNICEMLTLGDMKLPFQQEVLILLKQKLLPEIEQIKVEQQKFAMAQTQMQADIKVIDGHLVQIDQRFEQIDQRFEQVDKRFDQVDKQFDQVDKRFELVDKRFEQVDKQFEQVDKRFCQVEEQLRDLKEDLREVRSYVFTGYITDKNMSVRERPST